ncbi:hypothetical protein CKO42_17235 [Lamprobacter modestohalophilus]|uniref:RAMP superfamily protein n=1 Tax=Lamprobacter modestohalophilus TaxID=1064514 RepID=A0A9X0WAU8_9GAMM|nr:RAMP superfamily CRISPR-associated protein [Lamprobacter modestohalophilus]MBK1620153.1 hypothetical protein [Lamprobacter modestohalophilus]
MENRWELRLTLRSDASFAAGEGLAGLLDLELQHDRWGLPYLRGRSLKGLLVEECANLLSALTLRHHEQALTSLQAAARALFGVSGAAAEGQGQLSLGDAQLPADLRAAVRVEVDSGRLTPNAVLDALSGIRRQTAMTPQGAPETGSLRSQRVLLRATELHAELTFGRAPTAEQLGLLAACVACLRRAGGQRNRGLGRLRSALYENDTEVTERYWQGLKPFILEAGA